MSTFVSRRRLLRTGVAVGSLSLAGCSWILGGGGRTAAGWPMYGAGPTHRGVTADAGPGADLDVRWEQDGQSLLEDEPEGGYVTMQSDPVVADGTLYVVVSARTADRNFGVDLLALDAADGSEQWRTAVTATFVPGTGNGLIQPTVTNGTVVVGVPGFDPPHSAVGVDAASGDVLWRAEPERMPVTSATPGNGQLVFGARPAFALTEGGEPGWGFDAGEERYPSRTRFPPTVSERGAYVPTRGALVALDSQGEQRWERSLAFEDAGLVGGRKAPYPPAVGDAVYVTTGLLVNRSDGRMLALDPGDGSTRWEFKPDIEAGVRRERITAADPDERRRLLGTANVGVYGTPALWNGTLYVPGSAYLPDDEQRLTEPTLFAVSSGDGRLEWSTPLPGPIGLTPPAIAGGTVYVATGAGVARIDASSGDRLGTQPGEDDFARGLAVAGDAAYLNQGGSIVALGP